MRLSGILAVGQIKLSKAILERLEGNMANTKRYFKATNQMEPLKKFRLLLLEKSVIFLLLVKVNLNTNLKSNL
jgi:hypothetical protein